MSGCSLYSNKRIKKEKHLRWQSFFVDFGLTMKYKADVNPYCTNWSSPFLFTKQGRQGVPKNPGIYIFFVVPSYQIHHTQSFALYVGYSMNLFNRYYDYICYKRSDEPNHLERRMMLNIWEDCLYYSYVSMPGMTEKDIQTTEEKIIDALVPPINRDFINATIKEQVRIYRK